MLNHIWQIKDALVALHREDSSQDVIEYALLMAVIALGVVLGLSFVSGTVGNTFSKVGGKFQKHVGKHLGWYK